MKQFGEGAVGNLNDRDNRSGVVGWRRTYDGDGHSNRVEFTGMITLGVREDVVGIYVYVYTVYVIIYIPI